MDIIHIITALLAPLPVMAKYANMNISAIIYLAGALFVAWALEVLLPVSCILVGFVALYFLLASSSTSVAVKKNPQP